MNEHPLQQDPAIYLREQPSPTSPCHLLVEQLESFDGDHVPMHMLAKVAVRLHQAVDWMARWDGREKFARRAAAALIALTVANIGTVVTSWLHAHDDRIVAEADARAFEKSEADYRRSVELRFERLEQDIRDLRRELRKMSGSDRPDGMSIVTLEGKIPAFLLSAPAPDPVPMSCGGGCSTNGECQGIGRCNYCYLGKCSETLPATPPQDAGVDSAPGGTTP